MRVYSESAAGYQEQGVISEATLKEMPLGTSDPPSTIIKLSIDSPQRVTTTTARITQTPQRFLLSLYRSINSTLSSSVAVSLDFPNKRRLTRNPRNGVN